MKFCIQCMAKMKDTKDVCPFCGQQQKEGVKSAFHLNPGITLKNGRYLLGKAVSWDGFSVIYAGRDLVGNAVVTVREYVPEAIARRQVGMAELSCVSKEELEAYKRGLQSFMETAQIMKEQADLLLNVQRVLDCFYENGTAYIVAEYLNGQTVEALLKNGHIFSWDSAKQVIDAVLEGVFSLNQADIYHQDIHPSSIMITADGQIKLMAPGGFRYKLIGNKIQRAAVVRNGYSAEEQYRNKGKIGAATDVYSVGAVMYHMLTGTIPISAAERLQEDVLEIPKEIRGSIPQNIQNAMMNSLQLLADERTGTPRKFQRELSEQKVERIVGTRHRKEGIGKKRTIAVVVAAVLALCFLGAVAGSVILKGRPGKTELSAEQAAVTPNLVGMSKERAEEAAKKAGLQLEIVDIIPSEQALDNVVKQEPEANKAVGENQTVQITLSGSTEKVMLSNLRGVSEKDAVKELRQRNLSFHEEDFERRYTTGEESSQVEKGSVIAVLLDGESMTKDTDTVEQQKAVSLQISLGDYETEVPELSVPDFTGMTLEEARNTLENLKTEDGNSNRLTFRIGETAEENSLDYGKGQIISQGQEAEMVIRPCDENGEPVAIDLVVSSGPKQVEVPDVTGMAKDDAVAELEEGLFTVSTTTDYSSSVSYGKVIQTYPAAGETVDQGSVVTLKISSGSKPTTGGGTSGGGTSGGGTSSGGSTGGGSSDDGFGE